MRGGHSRRPLAVVVLAAGQGKRFRSERPKVLHEILGHPMLEWVLDAVQPLAADETVVVTGHGGAEVRAAFATRVRFATQTNQLGTAHALKAGLRALNGFEGDLLVLCGDTPLLSTTTLRALVARHRRTGAAATLLTAELDDPTGYGRIIRGTRNAVVGMVEHRDASREERSISEVNAGVYCFDVEAIRAGLKRVRRDNSQGEEYLPDAVVALVAGGHRVDALVGDADSLVGVNDRGQLAQASLVLRSRIIAGHAAAGVTIVDPMSTLIGPRVRIGRDAVIWPNTHLAGSTNVKSGAIVGPNVQATDTTVGPGAHVWFAVCESADIGREATVGPFAYLRPGATLRARSKVGTFVEVKGSTIGEGSKVPHLSYIGDADIGRGVNIGAASVTVNYDPETKVKARTIIGDQAKIGSDTMLIAPVRVGRGAVTGAGSVVTHDVPSGTVVVGNPARPLRKRK